MANNAPKNVAMGGVIPPMPPATITNVLSFLDVLDLLHLRLVSKQLKNLVLENGVWEHHLRAEFGYSPLSEELSSATQPGVWYNEYKAVLVAKKRMAESKLSFKTRTTDGIISEDGLTMECFRDFPYDEETLMHGSVIAQNSISQIPQLPGYVYYYEITIESETKGKIAVGLAPKPMYRGVPGWAPSSIGIKLDDGKLYSGGPFGARAKGEPYVTNVKKGDVVGCGINLSTREQFFTLNGEVKVPAVKRGSNQLDSILFLYHAAILSPTVALFGKGEKISINFGTKPFCTDLNTLKKGDSPLRSMSKLCQLVREDYLMQEEEMEFGPLKQHFYSENWTRPEARLVCSEDKELAWRIIELFWLADPGKAKTTEEMEPELKRFAKRLDVEISYSNLEDLREKVKLAVLKSVGEQIMNGFVEYVGQKIWNREQYEQKEISYEPGLALLSYLHDEHTPSNHPLMAFCIKKYKEEQKNYHIFLGEDFDTSRPDFRSLFTASLSVLQYITLLDYWKDRRIRENESSIGTRQAPVQLMQAGPNGFVQRIPVDAIKQERLALSSGELDDDSVLDRMLTLYLRLYFDIPQDLDMTKPIDEIKDTFISFLENYEQASTHSIKQQRMRDMATVMRAHAMKLQDSAIPDNSPIIADIKANWKNFFNQMAPGLDYSAVSRQELAANLIECVKQINRELQEMQEASGAEMMPNGPEASEVEDPEDETVSTLLFLAVGVAAVGACAWAFGRYLTSK